MTFSISRRARSSLGEPQAATQRGRMQAMGIEAPPRPEGGGRNVPGAINPIQNQMGRPTDVNVQPA